jgi:hypothetical protein
MFVRADHPVFVKRRFSLLAYFKTHKLLSLLLVFLIFLLAAVAVFLLAGGGTALAVAGEYPWPMLAGEAGQMHECAECHDGEELHTCDDCHDDHGAIELAGVPFFAYVELLGDVPNPGFVQIAEILPYPDMPYTHITLTAFLEAHEASDFESVTLVSGDGGFVNIEREALTERALLLPYQDGIRFASEDLHVSTWLKGIRRIIVIGHERSLLIAGEATSFGRLLLSPTRSVTVEQAAVMLVSDVDGQIRKAQTASRMEGVALTDIFTGLLYKQVVVLDQNGEEHRYLADEINGAILTTVQGQLTLVLPERGRAQWIEGVQVVDVE